MEASPSLKTKVHYPDSDGQPMADNTIQYECIVTLNGNLELLFADDPNVFVAGDLFWYPWKTALISVRRPIRLWSWDARKGTEARTSSGKKAISRPRWSLRYGPLITDLDRC